MLSPMRAAATLSRRGISCGIGYRYACRSLPQNVRSFSLVDTISTRRSWNPPQASRWQTVRFASTETAQADGSQPKKISSLKTVLRRFYLMTHPDKFSEHPEAKATNEASLRDFMAYMDDYKKHPRGYPGGRLRKLPLTFYVRDEREGTRGELRKVTGELLVNASNPHAAKRRITNLFKECGLDGDFTFEHDVWMPPDTDNLHDFLASALGHARESIKTASVHTTFVNAALSNIERKYGVKIDMSTGEETYWSPSENKEVAEKLLRLFSLLEGDGWTNKGFLKGMEVGLDSETEQCAQDTSGKVYLSRKESVEEWETFLRQAPWSELHERRAKAAKTHLDEARTKAASEMARSAKHEDLAKILGVRKIEIKMYNSFESQFSGESKEANRPLKDDWNEEEVEDFEKEAHGILDKLLAAKQILQNKNSKFAKKLRNIAITFCPNMPADKIYHIDRIGELFVSTRITAKELMQLLTDKIGTILELQRNEQKYAAIRDFVEVRLGLKILSVDYNYYHSHEDAVVRCNEAFEKLQRLVDKLSSLQLSGMTMAISDHYGLNLDGSLFIKHDFSDKDVILLLEGIKHQQEQEQKEDAKEEPMEQKQQA